MRRARDATSVGERIGAHRFLVGRPKVKNDFKVISVVRMIILKWIFRRRDGGACTRLIWLRLGVVGGLF